MPIWKNISDQDWCLCVKPGFHNEKISGLRFHFFTNFKEIFNAVEGYCFFQPCRVLWPKHLHLKWYVLDKRRLTCKWAMGPCLNLQMFNHNCSYLALVKIKHKKIKELGYPVQRDTLNTNFQEGKQCSSRHVMADIWKCVTYVMNRWLNGILHIFYYCSFENDCHNTLLPTIAQIFKW